MTGRTADHFVIFAPKLPRSECCKLDSHIPAALRGRKREQEKMKINDLSVSERNEPLDGKECAVGGDGK